MRKYQQLLLLLISVGSITVLLIYKSENSKLKYVLQVVNFFSRNDANTLLNFKDYSQFEQSRITYPLPVWQAIGDQFHAYAAYWNQIENANGEVIALVAGRHDAVVDFQCSLFYEGATRIVPGKFNFQRMEGNTHEAGHDFVSYKFFCRANQNFGLAESVGFIDVTSHTKTTYNLLLRHLKNYDRKDVSVAPQPISMCVDMVNIKENLRFISNTSNLIQFFHHHQTMGINDFIVYNGDEIKPHVQQLLHHIKLNVYFVPFNFPFARSDNSMQNLRIIIETDCLLRTFNFTQNVLLLQPNEFFYINTKVTEQSITQSQIQYTSDISRFDITTYDICYKHNQIPDDINNINNPNKVSSHRLVLHRLAIPLPINVAPVYKYIALPESVAFAYRYTKC